MMMVRPLAFVFPLTFASIACVGLGPEAASANGPPGGVAPAQQTVAMNTPYAPTGKPGRFLETIDATVFQRGNVHTHSVESDGDSTPEAIYAWYRDHGYNFLGLSDHNHLTDPARFRQLERPGFVIIPAEEITLRPSKVPVHVNALCERQRIGGMKSPSVPESLRWAVQQTLAQGGIALVNHPNFKWAFGSDMLAYAQGAQLLEIWSGHPEVHAMGDEGHPSEEAIWEVALTRGYDFAPVAVDDMHFLGAEGDPSHAGPGRGWIDVFASQATEREICGAMAARRLLASNGVRLRRLHVEGAAIELVPDAPGGVVEFIGRTGALLERQAAGNDGQPNVYRLRGGEGYVRARVTATNGTHAWTAAYRIAEAG